jgi:hypothetical protein
MYLLVLLLALPGRALAQNVVINQCGGSQPPTCISSAAGQAVEIWPSGATSNGVRWLGATFGPIVDAQVSLGDGTHRFKDGNFSGTVSAAIVSGSFTPTIPFTLTGGTVTVSTPLLLGTQTWNAGGVAFKGISFAFTETASAAGACYLEILGGAAGTTSEFCLQKGGTGVFATGVSVPSGSVSTPSVAVGTGAGLYGTTNSLLVSANAAVAMLIDTASWDMPSGFSLRFGSSSTNSPDAYITRAGTNALKLTSDGSTAGSADLGTTAVPVRRTVVNIAQSAGTGTSVANVGANSCGTTAATIAGNQTSGVITVGATSGTQCRVTFTTAAPTARDCTSNDDTTTTAVRTTPVDVSNTDFIGTFTAGDKVSYVCFVR